MSEMCSLGWPLTTLVESQQSSDFYLATIRENLFFPNNKQIVHILMKEDFSIPKTNKIYIRFLLLFFYEVK